MAQPVDTELFDPAFLALLERFWLPLTRTPQNPVAGGHLSRRHGASLEFAELRPYEPGEDLRTVDWNAYLRLRRLFVRRYRAERSQDIYILLDTSRSMGLDPHKFAVARRIAAAVAVLGLRHLDRVTILPFAEAVADRFVQTKRSQVPVEMLSFLSRLEVAGGTSLGTCAYAAAEQMRRGALVVFITDFLDDSNLEGGLDALTRRNADTVFFHVYTGEEERPRSKGSLTLVDSETGERFEVTADRRTLEYYAEAFGRFTLETRSLIERAGATYVNARTDTPLEETLLRFIDSRVTPAAGAVSGSRRHA